MKEDLRHVLIFKTNITQEDKERVKIILEATQQVREASVDVEDIDRVLRVVSPVLQPEQIIEIINQQGFECKELE